MSVIKQFAVAASTGLTLLGMTASAISAGPMRMGTAMPPSALNFRVGTQPIPPFTGFTTNPTLGVTTSLAQQQALALQNANQRALLGSNPTLSLELINALRTNPILARDLVRNNPILARQLMRTDRGLARELQQIDPALSRELNVLRSMNLLNTNPNLANARFKFPFMSAGGYAGGYPASYTNPYVDPTTTAANVTSAQAQTMTSNAQAESLREAVPRGRLEQRRRAFDEWLYEREHTPSLEDVREREQDLVLRRSRNDPPLPEIFSAQALNSLLVELQKLEAKGKELAPVQLDEGLLKNINVTATLNGANFGLLKHDGELSWPAVLRDLPPTEDAQALREEINSLIKDAIDQAKTGKVAAGLLAQLYGDVRALREMLRTNAGELTFARYSSARRFLDELEGAVKALEQNDAANYILGKFAARGKTVHDLVQHMTSTGLVFAPAVSGDEAAYLALQRALAEASQRAQTQTASEQ